MYVKYIKRVFDVFFAFILLFVLSPLILLTAISLALINKGQIFYFQLRPGLHEQLFYIWKFKTMTDELDSSGNLLPDHKRITYLGKLIRRFSIDEILQLINVIKGDMSIVGPRPLLKNYLNLYSKEQVKRHLVKPGITGLAQVNGRNAISWEEKFNFDLEYVKNQSFALDFIILIKTIKIVLSKSGVNESEGITMTEFKGTKLE